MVEEWNKFDSHIVSDSTTDTFKNNLDKIIYYTRIFPDKLFADSFMQVFLKYHLSTTMLCRKEFLELSEEL